MSRLWTVGLLLAASLMPWQAKAALHWQPAPEKHGHGGHGAGKAFVLVEGGVNTSATLITPHLEKKVLPMARQQVQIRSVGVSGYYALVANAEQDGLSQSAVRYIYFNGRPSGRSPSELMALQKSPLELEPAPFAREHWRYLSGSDAEFILRFQDKPLPLTDVDMTTTNGTTATVQTDANGRLTVLIPEDFTDIQPGRNANKPAELLLTAEFVAADRTYRTTFSTDYHVNPSHWQSNLWGVLVMLGGMLLGFMIIKRKSKGKI